MRQDAPAFALLNESSAKRPCYIIEIKFDVESIYLTSHPNTSSIPGVTINNVLQTPSGISQRIIPDEGRTEIGSFSFKLVDVLSQFTQAVATRLADYKGLRNHIVRFYVGYRNPGRLDGGGYGSGTYGSAGYGEGVESELPDAIFDEFQLFQTQVITGVKFQDGVYSVNCADITRQTREEIFEPKRTTLRSSITATATTIPVYVTTGFTPIMHGSSFSDAPNAFAGYITLEDEIIRYTAKTEDSFTGCTRGVFNTKPVAHTVDINTEADRRQKIEEMIYLELPAPMLAYAVLTGIMKTAAGDFGIPSHWNLGVDPDLVRLSDFQGIGEDLWDTANDANGFVMAFQEMSKTDGKRFLESEVYQLIGCYSPVYYDGQLGLKRMNPVLIDAAGIVELNTTNVVSSSELSHNYQRVYNTIRVDWNYNGDEFTRSTVFIDNVSIETHDKAPIKTLKFKGLRGWRHSDAIIRSQINVFRDRYTSPPEELTLKLMPSMNWLEVGDIVKVNLPNVRDFAGNVVPINRSFEIERKSDDFHTGDVTVDLFGSTGRANPDSENAGTTPVLSDAFYTSQGTPLSSVVTIVVTGGVGVIQPGTYTLTGNANLNNAAAIYYYDGDLELSSGATLNITQNVQIRHSGFFTINGTINGIGNGQAGVADGSNINASTSGLSGYVGNSRGMDGLDVWQANRVTPIMVSTRPAATTRGKFSSFPLLSLEIVDDVLNGLPNDLRGTSGGPGEKIVNAVEKSIVGNGGTGADSGAGLAIIGRGISFGASGSIDLSGDDSASTSIVTSGIPDCYPGAGGAGGPGCLFIGLDGGSVLLPDIGGKFLAVTGTVPVNGNPTTKREKHQTAAAFENTPYAGFLDPALISNVDLSNVCYRIQYLPSTEAPQEDQNEVPLAPTALTVTGSLGANSIAIEVPGLLEPDYIEIYGSITNDRTDAVLVASGKLDLISHALATGALRYYWARVRRIVDGPDIFSDWFPESETDGVVAAPRTADTEDITEDAITAVLSTTAATTTIAQVQHTPDGQSFNTLIASLTYTPDVSGEVLVTVSGYADYTFDASGMFLDLQYSLQEDSGYDGFQEQHWFLSSPVGDARYFNNISLSRRFALVAGVAKTFKFMAAKLQSADDVDIVNVEMRLEAIKR